MRAIRSSTADGKHLYLTASTDSGPSLRGLTSAAPSGPPRAASTSAVLSKNDPSPLAPESDEEKVDEARRRQRPRSPTRRSPTRSLTTAGEEPAKPPAPAAAARGAGGPDRLGAESTSESSRCPLPAAALTSALQVGEGRETSWRSRRRRRRRPACAPGIDRAPPRPQAAPIRRRGHRRPVLRKSPRTARRPSRAQARSLDDPSAAADAAGDARRRCRRRLRRAGRLRLRRAADPAVPAADPGTFALADPGHRGPVRAARRVEADVPRRVADPARVLLRSATSTASICPRPSRSKRALSRVRACRAAISTTSSPT